MYRRLVKKISLIGLLVLLTAAWGTVVVAHQHLDTDPNHCEICLLPQLGSLPTALILELPARPSDTPRLWYEMCQVAVTHTHYQSRAPPT